MNIHQILVLMFAVISMRGFAEQAFCGAQQKLKGFNKTGDPLLFEQAIAAIDTSSHHTINDALDARFAMMGLLVPYLDKDYENKPHQAPSHPNPFDIPEIAMSLNDIDGNGKAKSKPRPKSIAELKGNPRIQNDIRAFFKNTVALSLLDETPSITKIIERAQTHKLPPEVISLLVREGLSRFAIEGIDDDSSLTSNAVYYAVVRPLSNFIPFGDFGESAIPSYEEVSKIVKMTRRDIKKNAPPTEALMRMLKRLHNVKMPVDLSQKIAYFRDKTFAYSLSMVLFVQPNSSAKNLLRFQFRRFLDEIDQTLNQLFESGHNENVLAGDDRVILNEAASVLLESKSFFEPLLSE